MSNNRRSDLEKSEDNSLYVSALEDVNDSMKRTRRSSNKVNSIFCDILHILEFTFSFNFIYLRKLIKNLEICFLNEGKCQILIVFQLT